MKRTFQTIVLSTLAMLLVHPLYAADDSAKAQKLVDRAIKAIGGKEALNKTVNTIMEDEGTYYGMGEGVPYTGRYVFQMTNPGRYRMEIVGQFIMVAEQDKAWVSAAGNVMDQEGDALKVAKQGILINYAMSLIPLQKPNKEFKLGLAKPATIDGEECEGITISHDKMPTITMHFSEKTGLIKKAKYKAKVPELNFAEVTEESVFHDYKEFEGVKNPTRVIMHRDGEKLVESRPQKITYPKKIDEKEFKKPN